MRCGSLISQPQGWQPKPASHLLRSRAGLLVELVGRRADGALRDALHLRLGLCRELVCCRAQLTVRELHSDQSSLRSRNGLGLKLY